MKRILTTITASLALALAGPYAHAQAPGASATLFQNANIFDGKNEPLATDMDVLVEGNKIAKIAKTIEAPDGAKIIDAKGRTLMPGLSDCHWHTLQAAVTNIDLFTKDPNYNTLQVAFGAERVLMNGFTTVRDMGGNIFGVKQMIDEGRLPGPRILPSGAFLTPTSGHAEMRFPNVLIREEGRPLIDQEILGNTAIADGVPAVLKRTRENLMRGASQLKVMAGGGVSSLSDPMDGAQFTRAELEAIVEEAGNWNTYVTVHAYTAKAVQHALKAGVRSIEHGHMIDEETAKMIADAGARVCMQPFQDDQDRIPFPKGSFSNYKYELLLAGVDTAFKLAKKNNIKIGFGTDMQNNPTLIDRQAAQIPKLTRWFTPFEALRIATSGNQEFFRLSGARHPYQEGPLGVVQEGAYADLLLVEGNPLENIEVIADPKANFKIIMKDGKIYKNTLQ